MKKKEQNITFEKALEEMELIVNKLEEGDMSLEESLNYFQNGIELYKHCNEILNKFDGKIKTILSDGSEEEVDFNTYA